MRVSFVAILVRSSMVLTLALVAGDVAAQSASTAQINGTVHDGGGLALPGVTIGMTQTDTGLARTTVTDDRGSYTLTNLPVGPYRFEAMLQGFRAYVQTGIVLQVN